LIQDEADTIFLPVCIGWMDEPGADSGYRVLAAGE
jgi:hypothetical protein